MISEVPELEKRRAENIIWNLAGSYDFEPDFKAFTDSGQAELYWNCIIGAVRKRFDYPILEKLLLRLQDYEDCDIYEGLVWLGLENSVFEREAAERPVLRELRQEYARSFLSENQGSDDYFIYDYIARAHWERVSGIEPDISEADRDFLNELEFSPELNTEEVAEAAQKLLERRFFADFTKKPKQRGRGLRKPQIKPGRSRDGKVRRFMRGVAEHPDNIYGGSNALPAGRHPHIATKLSDEELREFIRFKYGKPCFSDARVSELEREICTGNHEDCRLHFTRGEEYSGSVNNAFEALQKQKEALQKQKNREHYSKNIAANRTAVSALTAAIRNSVLLYLQSTDIKSDTGRINSPVAWRAEILEDSRVFTRKDRDDAGNISVDILLDASTSQKYRQETVSGQGYIIASSLTECGIPCRVSSFCSMTGYTILRTYRSYADSRDNDRIFDYVSNGCNRDGLAIRTLSRLMRDEPYDHKLLIVLSDAKPNDVVKIRKKDGRLEDYSADAGVSDTAAEVRRARAEGINVICVFTGADEDVASARLIYGKDFARITSLNMLADTVGKLILNTIRSL